MPIPSRAPRTCGCSTRASTRRRASRTPRLDAIETLDAPWHEASIGQTFGLRVTADELAALGAAVDAILRPYIALTRDDAPPDAQPVHVSLTAFRHPLP